MSVMNRDRKQVLMLHPWAIEEMKSDKRDDEGNSVRFELRFLDQRFMKQYVFAYKTYLFLELCSSDFLKLVDAFISTVIFACV